MNNEHPGAALALGVIGLVLEVISFFVFGWLSIVGAMLGIIGACLPTQSKGYKVPAIIAIPVGVIFAILWLVAVAAIR